MTTFLIPDTGADFSKDSKHRLSLWRIWDRALPLVMFIGLNPSTANAEKADPTIRSVIRLAKHNGYGGVYMMNCWTFITSNPKLLIVEQDKNDLEHNDHKLRMISMRCHDIVFAWGQFKIVSRLGRDKELEAMFPLALCLGHNKDGSPGHPLYKKANTKFITWKQQ